MLRLDLQGVGTLFHSQHDATEDVLGQGAIPVVHDQDILLGEFRLNAEFGLIHGLALQLGVPLKLVNTGIRYLDAGQEVELANPGIHHRQQTLFGIGDPRLSLRGVRSVGQWNLGVRVGTSVPLGRTENNPFQAATQGLVHEHVQFGSGTFLPLVGADVTRRFGPVAVSGSLFSQWSVYQNSKGFQPGNRFSGTLIAGSALGLQQWSFRAGLLLSTESAERWDGNTIDEGGNRGRTDLLGLLGVTLRLGENYYISPSVSVPIVTRSLGQLEYPPIVSLSFGRVLNTRKHDHDHDHEVIDQAPEPEDIDVVSLTDTGEIVELVPVPGKLTVFDFWATWCKPCVELDAALKQLARDHPGQLAIRKINIVEWDTPVSRKYLVPRSYSLPHLKVYGPDGSVLFERSGGWKKLVELVEAELQ